METVSVRCLLLSFLFACGLPPGVIAQVQESSDVPSPSQEPVRLTSVPAAMKFVAGAEVAAIGFFQDLETPVVSTFRSMVHRFPDVSFGISTDSEVLSHYNISGDTIILFRVADDERLYLSSEDLEKMDATKLSRFLEIHSLRLVTEYDSVSVIGLFNSVVQVHLLLIMNKTSPRYEESINIFREAAKLFQRKILFVLVDSRKKENAKVISFFKLKESQLPALAIYHTVDDKWDVVSLEEVSVEHVQNFCDGFLAGKLLRENPESEEKTPKEEL